MTPHMLQGQMPHPGVQAKDSEETAVYRLFDAPGRLLYVGMGRNPMGRWASHADQHEWWPQVASFTVTWSPTRAAAAAVEKEAIKGEAPLHNIHNTPRQGGAIAAGIAANAWVDGQSRWMRENRPATPTTDAR